MASRQTLTNIASTAWRWPSFRALRKRYFYNIAPRQRFPDTGSRWCAKRWTWPTAWEHPADRAAELSRWVDSGGHQSILDGAYARRSDPATPS